MLLGRFENFLRTEAEKLKYLKIGLMDFGSKTRFRKIIKFY
jgi:hypothetical protein